MKAKILFIATSFGLLLSCNETGNSDTTDNKKIIADTAPSIDTLEILKLEASRLRHGGSIKNIELIENMAVIHYVKDYTEYKQLQPQSSLTEADLLAYWETGDAIKKALIDGSVRLMRKLDYLKGTKIVLPYKGKTYTIEVNQTDLEEFIGADMEKIRNDWDHTFSNPFVYSETGRNKFFGKFGTVK